ncbi:MFS transporter [Mesotoga sp. UBA6090]|uniref:MFS transporter n=1 Tax=Mesotoga sp. UBA6090 TaxID=1946860 RepID=UPI0025F5984C|nr:MFS transporter [Mesotoga sp. UBA6090]
MNLSIFFFEVLIYASLATKNLLGQYFDISGFSSTEIGILMAVLPVVSLVSSPLWFKISSRLGQNRIYYIVSLSSAVCIWPIFAASDFMTSLLFMILFSLFFSGVVPLGDSIIMTIIKKTGGRFDRVRLFGTMGFAATSLLLSSLVGISFFWLFAATSVVLAFSPIFLEKKPGESRTAAPENSTGAGSLLQFSMMTIGMFFGITLNSFHNSFIAVFTRQNGMDPSVVGIVFAITALSEIPFLLVADRIIEKIGSMKILLFGMAVIGVRMILVSFATNVYALYLVESLHGLTYILMYYSLFHFIHYGLSGRRQIFAQSVFWIVRSGLTFIVGSIGGGIIIDTFSVFIAFRLFGFVGLLSAIIMTVVYFAVRRSEPDSG